MARAVGTNAGLVVRSHGLDFKLFSKGSSN
jgi:hypothetical protein